MISAADLISFYERTYDVIKRQTEGFTHEESLLQFPFEGNCLNWVMGHLTTTRTNLLAMLGSSNTVWTFAEAKRYIPGSQPITTSADALDWEKIISAFDATQTLLIEQLEQTSQEKLNSAPFSKPLGKELAYYHYHEAYHAGQLELFRRLAGKPPVEF